MKGYNYALQWKVAFTLASGLMIRSGLEGDFTDSSIEKDPCGRLHINGYVWASLLHRALMRVKDGDKVASTIGKYVAEERGISPLWTKSTFTELPETDVRPGNRIDRQYGTAAQTALFSDELVPPGLLVNMEFTWFMKNDNEQEINEEKVSDLKCLISWAFRVISEGIETIGSGWSYGHGRLTVDSASCREIALEEPKERKLLWDFSGNDFNNVPVPALQDIQIIRPWMKYKVTAKILEGQLLAVHTSVPLFDEKRFKSYNKYPDAFVYQGYRFAKPLAIADFTVNGLMASLLSIISHRLL
ncbi:MAG: hypothetical protein HQK96_20070 [Nitrospirae bacterium]|nr:hypothetical protein [Nitrospirota bacterium]